MSAPVTKMSTSSKVHPSVAPSETWEVKEQHMWLVHVCYGKAYFKLLCVCWGGWGENNVIYIITYILNSMNTLYPDPL